MSLNAGFGMQRITPPLGTRLFGFGGRDRSGGCLSINDNLEVRAVYIEQGQTRCLILGFDLLFFTRAEADRLKGMLSRSLNLNAADVLLNCSHTHAGPTTGDWGGAQPIGVYMEWLQDRVLMAATAAMAAARPVTLRAGRAITRLPVSRRYLQKDGLVAWAPALKGEIYPVMPFCCVDGQDGVPVALLFSVSCHPSTVGGLSVSADYPGEACRRLDTAIGAQVSLFLQGCAGDTKACVIADGAPDETGLPTWRAGTPADVVLAGQMVAEELLAALPSARPLKPLPNGIETRLQETSVPLSAPPDPAVIPAGVSSPDPVTKAWAVRQQALLAHGVALTSEAPLLLQQIHLAQGLRLIALEGEPVAGFGRVIEQAFPEDIVFPLGYSNGQGLYLPTDRMFPELGYEVTSAHEYGFPSNAVPGFEERLRGLLSKQETSSRQPESNADVNLLTAATPQSRKIKQ